MTVEAPKAPIEQSLLEERKKFITQLNQLADTNLFEGFKIVQTRTDLYRVTAMSLDDSIFMRVFFEYDGTDFMVGSIAHRENPSAGKIPWDPKIFDLPPNK